MSDISDYKVMSRKDVVELEGMLADRRSRIDYRGESSYRAHFEIQQGIDKVESAIVDFVENWLKEPSDATQITKT